MPSALAASVRAKFPGVYDDMTDEQLEKAVLAKYPGYKDLTKPEAKIGPAPWTDVYPNVAAGTRTVLNTLPGIGGIAGAVLAGPETMGLGSIPGVALGATAGQGLRDIISQALGLEKPRSFLQNTAGAGAQGVTDAIVGAAVPGTVQALATPLRTAGEAAEAFTPRVLKSQIPIVQEMIDRARGALKPGASAVASPAASVAPETTPRLVKAGGSSALSDALTGALEDARKAPTTSAGTTPPPATTTPAGKPSITAEQYDQGVKAASDGASRLGSETAPRKVNGTKTSKFAEQSQGADQLSELLDRVYGGEENVPTKGNGTYKPVPSHDTAPPPSSAKTGSPTPGDQPSSFKDDITRLRREYGADRIAKELNPNAPEPVVGQVVKQSGAPSAMPDMAQRQLLAQLRDPSTVKNPGAFHRAISQALREYKRNGGAAKSDTAKEVFGLLKKYGYDVGSETGEISPETAVATGAAGLGGAYAAKKLFDKLHDLRAAASQANHTYNPYQRAADTLEQAGKQ